MTEKLLKITRSNNPFIVLMWLLVYFGAMTWLYEANYSPYIAPFYFYPICWLIAFPILFILFFSKTYQKRRHPSFMDKLKRDQIEKGGGKFLIMLIAYCNPFFIAVAVVYFISILPVTLTDQFAHNKFTLQATVKSIDCENNRIFKNTADPAHTIITFEDNLSQLQNSLNFSGNRCKEYTWTQSLPGKTLTLKGRKWFFGSIIDEIEYIQLNNNATQYKNTLFIPSESLPQPELILKNIQMNF